MSTRTDARTQDLERRLARHGAGGGHAARPALEGTPLFAALHRAGTSHIYADTADVDELEPVISTGAGAIRVEIDGNTANQPLVRKVLDRHLDSRQVATWAEVIEDAGESGRERVLAWIYAVIVGRIGNGFARAFAAGRVWEASLQLHMGLCHDPEGARRVGHLLHEMLPSALVKVPFTPDAPHCLLVARDLEAAGIPVNLTSTFSARQAAVGALFADVSRTNIFMGRLDQGLQAERLGAHVDLEAQRLIRSLRRDDGVRTRLIIASIRDWRTFVDVAGCDAFTAPCEVLAAFLDQDEFDHQGLPSRLETTYGNQLGIAEPVLEQLGMQRIERLYRVEPELVEFLRELRASDAHSRIDDGEHLRERFEQAGFGDLFHAPSEPERAELERGKLPELDGELVRTAALDTHYSLLANADFVRHQRAIDEELEQRLGAA